MDAAAKRRVSEAASSGKRRVLIDSLFLGQVIITVADASGGSISSMVIDSLPILADARVVGLGIRPAPFWSRGPSPGVAPPAGPAYSCCALTLWAGRSRVIPWI